MQACRIQHEDEHFRRDAKDIIARDERQQRAATKARTTSSRPCAPNGRQRAKTALPEVRAAASARPSNPHGRTISTIAITRKTRTIEIFGKTRMPKALSSETMIAARRVPVTLPRPPITTTTSASVITCTSIVWLGGLARQFKRATQASEKDAEREDTGEQPFLVDAERRNHLAILSGGPHQHAPGRAVEDEPDERKNERSEPDQQEVVGRGKGGRRG